MNPTKRISERTCLECESHNVAEHSNIKDIKDEDGNRFILPNYRHSVCSNCGFEYIDSEQSKHNFLLMKDAERERQGLLTSTQIRAIREKYDIRQNEAARIFGGGPNSFSKYELGYVTQSSVMDNLLRAAEQHPRLVEFLRFRALAGNDIELDDEVGSGPHVKNTLLLAGASREAGTSTARRVTRPSFYNSDSKVTPIEHAYVVKRKKKPTTSRGPLKKYG